MSLQVKTPSPPQYIERFDFSQKTFGEVNQVRRKLLADIETYAIDAVEIIENNTALIDDIIVHRLYMLLINSKDIGEASCTCLELECPRCTMLYKLDVTNNTREVLSVYSQDLKPEDDATPNRVVPNILLLRLQPGAKIFLYAYIQRGKGSEHAAWNHCHAYHNTDRQLIVEHHGTIDVQQFVSQYL